MELKELLNEFSFTITSKSDHFNFGTNSVAVELYAQKEWVILILACYKANLYQNNEWHWMHILRTTYLLVKLKN